MARATVARVDPSPMNASRWCIELRCGHHVWVTAKRRPKTTVVDCKQCDELKAWKAK